MLPDLSTVAWAALGLAAVLVGFSKTALPGINTLAVAIFAAVLPAKPSTGALLLLLIVGDMFALWTYRKHAHWPTLVRMLPAVLVGLALGGVFLAFAGDSLVRRVIGVMLLLLMALTLWQRHRDAASREDDDAAPPPASRTAAVGYGSLGGFTTMVANAGGPVMSMYFLAARFPKHAFLGTAAWFFAVMNLLKVPVSMGLGLISLQTLVLDVLLVPGVVLGAFAGRWAISRIRQRVFETAVIVVTVLGALYLLV
ncbi:sulfite exporter TauE/SafE family protein [Kocuria sp.]|uniref:sulfite exporter TauE/SafE family protein n=1 Tax=Kocuria sp. TaxID=1871328 RepID=UPI0026DCB703|nr:sulfite exporter TauE/SafE family protein [Kocuria sp.]MDO4918336.1 sulfite exporter TauE/SafE family protein [Kocuria sp.]